MTVVEQPPGPGSLLAPVRGRLAACVALVALASLASLVPLLGVVELARILLADQVDAGRAWLVVWVSVAALAIRLATLLGAALLSHLVDLDLSDHIRRSLVARLGRVPLSWFTDRNSGLVKKAVQDDVAALHHLVAHAVLEVTAAVVVPVAVLAYLFAVDWRMALLTMLPIVLAVVGFSLAMRGSAEKFVEYDRSLGQLGSASVEFVEGITVVKTFGEVGRAHRRFTAAADRFADFYRGWMRSSSIGTLTMELAANPLTALVVVLVGGVALASGGSLSPVDLVPFVVLGLAVTAPVTTIGYSAQGLREAWQAAGRIVGVLAEPEMPVPADPAPVRVPADGRVEFTGVDFSYGPTRVLHTVDLVLEPGTVTALVGPSGSGKSTLAKLLPRFVDVESGSVRIGGVDLRDLRTAQLYEQVGFVFQDVSLLRTSVRDNIRLARPDAPDHEVRVAASAARILDRLDALPRGLDSVVGEDALLSGGESQRVSIARALLADAPILVLDEATAAADPESEAQIQDALSSLASGRTLLVIAHRLSTITEVDQIVVLDEGRVAERGTHEDLLELDGLYARMWRADQRSTSSQQIGARP